MRYHRYNLPVATLEKISSCRYRQVHDLDHYEVLSLLGAGGMGEVYTARDTRLDRIVAIKVSLEQFTERFEREAPAVGALSHANICSLFDVGPNFLVMEYVEGETLSGPLPLNSALAL